MNVKHDIHKNLMVRSMNYNVRMQNNATKSCFNSIQIYNTLV